MQDGGDAETGTSAAVGGAVTLKDAASGLAIDVRARQLVVRQDNGFAEHGISVSISYDARPGTPTGLRARITPGWGEDANTSADALWSRESMHGLRPHGYTNEVSNRLDTEIGYGVPIGTRLVGTPQIGFRNSEYGRDYRVGCRMEMVETRGVNVELGVNAEHRESPLYSLNGGEQQTDRRSSAQATIHW